MIDRLIAFVVSTTLRHQPTKLLYPSGFSQIEIDKGKFDTCILRPTNYQITL